MGNQENPSLGFHTKRYHSKLSGVCMDYAIKSIKI